MKLAIPQPILHFLRSRAFFAVPILAGAVLRIYYVFQVPAYTTDLLRNLGYGMAFHQWGFQIYDLTPLDISPWPPQFLWPTYHYTYPAVTILFFALVTAIHNSLFWGKLVLTLLDAGNSWLTYKVSQDRWLALLYWLNPISLWFGSHEGQFEPLAVFWTLLALLGLKHRRAWAYGVWGLAVQSKVFPIVLAPYFLSKLSWKQPKRLAQEIGWGLLSGLPSFLAMAAGPYIIRYGQKNYMPSFNPITWSLGDPALYPGFSYELVLAHWFTGLIFVLGCLLILLRRKNLVEIFAPLFFVVWVKANLIGQFWYLMLTPALCLTVQDRRDRRILCVLAFLLCIRSLYSIFIGPIGYLNPPDAQYLMELAFWGF